MDVFLHDIVDIESFQKQVDKGFISERKDTQDDRLRVYCYTPLVQFEGLWTKETLLARGLIVRLDENYSLDHALVLGRGLSKFFTVEQVHEGDWTHIKVFDDDENITVSEETVLDLDAPAFVADKLDGSLIIMFLDNYGQIRCGTKGSLGSSQAKEAEKIIAHMDEDKRKILYDFLLQQRESLSSFMSPVFEVLIHGEHPIDYGKESKLVFLGCINVVTGEWNPADDKNNFDSAGFTHAEVMHMSSLREALEAPSRPYAEGYVVTYRDNNGVQKMSKVKTQDYYNLRRIFTDMFSRKNLDHYIQQLTYHDIMTISSPEDIILPFFSSVDTSHAGVKKLVALAQKDMYSCILHARGILQHYYNIAYELYHDSHGSRRSYAEKIACMEKKEKSILFSFYNLCDGKATERTYSSLVSQACSFLRDNKSEIIE